jgi:hypothetical protein
MERAAEYLTAGECLDNAKQAYGWALNARDRENKAAFLDLASVWLRAAQRAGQLERPKSRDAAA